jgi:hypothetical protein
MATKTGHLLKPLVVRPSIALVALVVAMGALLIAFNASPARAAVNCITTGATTTCTYVSTGSEQIFTVPDGVSSVSVVAIGAPGSSLGNFDDSAGRGARVSGDLTELVAGQKLYVNVGGAATGVHDQIGGFNGGGSSSFYGGGGGGASDVRTVSRSGDPLESLKSRLIVAGGSGGSGTSITCDLPDKSLFLRGGAGGDAGNNGGDGPPCGSLVGGTGGKAGTQSEGGLGGSPKGQSGSLGQGGDSPGTFGFGGGGGGYYGGGGGGDMTSAGSSEAAAGGGGGGSNLVPTGGSAPTITSDSPSVTISYTVPVDTTPPTLTVTHTADGTGGWNKTSPVTVNVSASDSDSGLAGDPTCKDGNDALTLTAGSTPGTWTASVSGERTHNISCSVSDKANNSSGPKTDTVKIDTIAPSISDLGPTTQPNTAGWFNTDVTNTFKATDSGSGIDGATFQDKTSSGQGSSVSITSDAFSDKAGNTATGAAGPFKIDLSDPTITTSLSPAKPASSGWYNAATAAPTVGFTCSDSVSGLATACPADHTFANGTNQSHEGTVTDRAGRSATTNVKGINVDLDAPSAPVATTTPLNPVANSGDFFKDQVRVSYGGSTDVGPSGIAGYSDTQPFNTTGSHDYSGVATDKAGNMSAATTGSVKVDADAPTVGITGCPTSPVLLNSTQSITVAAGDVGSGLVSNPSGSVSLDTTSVGPKTKTIKVADKVGHSNSATCGYSVKYGFTGFLSPIPQSRYIAGSTIPVKFGLANAAGTRISDAAAQALVASPCKVKVSFNSGTKNCAVYNATTDTFQFDVKTPKSLASGLYNIVVEVSDGSGVVNSETVQVNIRH